MNAGINRMLQTTAIVFLMVHLMSCIWFLIAKMSYFNEDTWVAQLELIDESKTLQYLQACNWAFQTLTTVGYGGVPATTMTEKIVSLMWMFFGVGFYSFTIGNLATIISNIDVKASHLQQKLTMLSEFSRRKRLPEGLEARIKKFIENNH